MGHTYPSRIRDTRLPHLSVPDGLFQLTNLGLYCVLVSQDVCQTLCQLILRAKKEKGVTLALQEAGNQEVCGGGC